MNHLARLEDDWPVFAGLFEYVSLVSGATLTAARLLAKGQVQVAINWNGGRHHGRP
jgi:histone deacetylase 8